MYELNLAEEIKNARKDNLNDKKIEHPLHYTSSKARCSKCGCPIECIDITRHLGFNLGNVIKYLWRAGLKDNVLQELKKARWYLDDSIKELEQKCQSKT